MQRKDDNDRTRFGFVTLRFLELMLAVAAVAALSLPIPALGQSRIKDIAEFEGIRENQLVGYGLVVGLDGSGDRLANSPFTEESLKGMLERLGVKIANGALNTQNVGAVMVTATLPPFARQGSRIDVTVSALGDASSLLGGTLLVTPLMGADGEVYAIAQGSLAVAGFSATGDAQTVVKNVPTTGRIAGGAIVERELSFAFADLDRINIALRNPDLTTAQRVAKAINTFTRARAASVSDPTTVALEKPANYAGNLIALLSEIEQLRVTPDQIARVVIDQRSGVIVIGENVRISRIAIAQGNLTIRITEAAQVSQPNPFSETGTTEVVPRTNIEVDEDKDKRMAVLDTGVSLQSLVNGLNALGIGPRDMMSILQTIKAAGALQAEIETM